jgi:hypothetical protein
VQVRPGGWSGGGDQLTTEQRLRTTLDAAALLAHFAPQLAAQGWTLVDRAASRSAALQSARRRLPNGETWRALLVAQRASDDGDVDVVLRLARGEVP